MPILELSFASKEDSLSVRHFSVREEISGLFEITILARSPQDELDLESIVGHGAGFALDSGVVHLTTSARAWTGICSHMELVQVESTGLSTYALTIVPALWRTTLRKNSRIFQHLTIPDIVTKVLAEWQIVPEKRLSAEYLKHEYLTQYDETDHAFVSRLLEEAGIAYFFTFDGSQTKLVLSDEPTAGEARPTLPYADNPNDASEFEYVTKVKLAQEVKPGRYAVRDFDFRNKLDAQLFAEARAATETPYEQYVYEPGAFWYEPGQGGGTPVADDKGIARTNPGEGDKLAQRKLDGDRRARRALAYETNVVDLAPGVLLTIDPHPRQDIGGKKLLVIASTLQGAPGEEWTSTGRAVYTDVVYRPARRTRRPRVEGVQSAVVVGPAGEEIHVDEFGRVRVQFHWDREGTYDDDSAVWIRPSQGWAGAGYGLLDIPRVGQEVLVEFFEGNPDQPVITGRVFSYTRRVLYKLPDNKTKSGWKTETYPGAGGFNELSFEDAAGREEIHVQAQKDFTEIIKNNQSSNVRSNRSASVTVADSMTVGGSQSFSVGGEQSHTIAKVQANDIGEDRTSTIAQSDTIDAGNVITGVVGPGVGYVYRDDQLILITNGVASVVFTPDGMYLDAQGDITISAGRLLKVSADQVAIDGRPNVYFNRDAKRLRLEERLKLIEDARRKAEGMPPGPERDALLAAASRLSRNNRAVENARLAADTYNTSGAPEGWERLETWESPSGFYAVAYRSQIDGRTVVAYRGTEPATWQDWVHGNLTQGAGVPSPQYAQAASVARQAQARYGNNLEFTGHSLGGGLAATGAMATGRRADTFNAAGINPMSYLYYGLDRSAAANVDNHTVDGEVLTTVQGVPLVPDAVGNQYPLPAVRTRTGAHGDTLLDASGQPTFEAAPENGIMESVDRHSRYIDGIEFQKAEDVRTIRGML
ncbi:type VI secretion system tip protein TssI/VgrG [Chondromyces apiculatus]|uniref:VgrG protein n=1 Tax=Chondromyces apiculatus DSM 436 TaxID=1192034 RepID=A0A017TA00_9BACT|nr:type VI secretion system tip protein TssI/VgrG [Chondromyces apiculatus]EYF05451.1 VgrG protein [Chondromyces apiculatus DSM 436]